MLSEQRFDSGKGSLAEECVLSLYSALGWSLGNCCSFCSICNCPRLCVCWNWFWGPGGGIFCAQMKPERDVYLYRACTFLSLKRGWTPMTLLHLLLICHTCTKAAFQLPCLSIAPLQDGSSVLHLEGCGGEDLVLSSAPSPPLLQTCKEVWSLPADLLEQYWRMTFIMPLKWQDWQKQ